MFRVAVLAAAVVAGASAQVPEYTYRVIRAYPHDPSAFTQGLEFRGGVFYEGTGLHGRSSLRKVEIETGKVLQSVALDSQYFGEGITLLGGQIMQLTWQAHKGFIYDQATLRLLREFKYPGEGWGLTNDGKHLFESDGTAEIRVWNPKTFEETRRITVHDGAAQIREINELEFVNGEIYANIWQTDRIARISPADGKVLGWIDLSGLLTLKEKFEGADVLNGIAYDPMGGRLFVTGKLWPKVFEIELVKKARAAAKGR